MPIPQIKNVYILIPDNKNCVSDKQENVYSIFKVNFET